MCYERPAIREDGWGPQQVNAQANKRLIIKRRMANKLLFNEISNRILHRFREETRRKTIH